jgi:tetratricopeptide (TPR) repeat protein
MACDWRRQHGHRELRREAVGWRLHRMRLLILAVAAALVLGLLPNVAQAVPLAALSPSQTADAARVLLMMGNQASALSILDEAIERHPQEPELWFLRGLALRAVGDLDGAIVSLRRVWELAPAHPRPLLEAAAILVQQGDYDRAYDTFSAALAITTDRMVRRTIRRHMEALLPLKTLSYGFGLRIQPDQNPGAASGRSSVNIGGLDFELDRTQRARAGLGIGGDAVVRYAPPITASTRLVTDAALSGLHFFGDCCDDYQITTAAGLGWFSGPDSVVAQAFVRHRSYDQEPYSVEHGLRLEVGRAEGVYAVRAGVEFGQARLIALDVPGEIHRGFLSFDAPITGTLSIGGTGRLEDARYEVAAQAYRAASLELWLGLDGPWAFPMRITGMALRRAFDGPSVSSEGNRVDWAWAASASVLVDTISVWGASPIVGVSYQRQISNEALAEYGRVSLILGLSRFF